MMNETRLPRIIPELSSGSGHSFGTPRHPSVVDPILSKRVCFYKSGDPQFNGLRMVINNRTFKTFDALLDSLSKKVPLAFGVRNITTPRGIHAIYSLDELEDGSSYICSDYSKVKPINLALAKKKMPPWYHARPVSSRRWTVQQARLYPGQNALRQKPVVVRTPKRLLVFRNGDPSVRHTVILQKRTTPTFEFILEYISELMQFQVVKLHTPDGRRVDSLAGLILCSGTVVAVGKEPFKPANYTPQKTQFPTWLPNNRMGLRRLKAANRKKKSALYAARTRHFSPSSERYIVNQIHNSIAESSCDLASNPANSVELESSHVMDSLAETEGDTGLGDGAEGQDCVFPTDDDIEKSFRVNQDGSISVEMKVRLTIKEEETIHWTTTLTRASVANHLNETALPEFEPGQEVSSHKSNPLDAANHDGCIETTKNEFNNDDLPSLENGLASESSNEEDNIKAQMDVMSPRRALTPGHRQVQTKQAFVESITSVTADGIQESVVGLYAYKEPTEDGALMEYCTVKQSSTKPVPKPRRCSSEDANSINNMNVSTFKTAGMTEILQVESSGEEVTETILHIYEQQTFQDNFFANVCAQGVPNSGVPPGRPATRDTAQFSNSEFETKPGIAPKALESTWIWGGESMSPTSDLTPKTRAIQATSAQGKKPTLTKNKDKSSPIEVTKDKRISSKGIKKGVYRILSPGKTPKEPSDITGKRKKVKTFSSAGFIKRIYGNKTKSAKNITKVKKTIQNKNMGVPTQSVQLPHDMIKYTIKDPNTPSPLTVPLETHFNQPRGLLTRQTSMHQDNKNKNESYDVNSPLSLPAFNSSSNVTNEYVATWLKNAHLDPAVYTDEESKKSEPAAHPETDSTMSAESESHQSLNAAAQEVKCLEEESEIATSLTVKSDSMPENLLGTSVKQRIQSFENQLASSNPLTEKTTVSQQHVHGHTSILNAENTTEEHKLFSNGPSSEMNPLICNSLNETPPEYVVENESTHIKLSPQTTKPPNTCSMANPPPVAPPSAENIGGEMEQSNTEHSAASSPLYRLSSMSSQTTDMNTLSCSATTDWTISTSDHNGIPSTPNRAPIPRTSSIKRAPLVSNLSLERKMSLRKACVDKYALSCDATLEKDTCLPLNTAGENMLSNSSTGTQRPSETLTENKHHANSSLGLRSGPSCCTSASPTSLSSKERASSTSISSGEAPTSSDAQFNKEKMTKTQPHPSALTEASSPKPLAKHVKPRSSPSAERKSATKKSLPEKAKLPNNSAKSSPSPSHNHRVDTTASRNPGIQKHAAPNASPSTDRKQVPQKPHLQTKLSPYSQSLDMVSPPQRHKSNRKTLSRNVSSDSAPELTNKTQKRSSPHRKPTSTKPKAELQKTLNGGKCAQVTAHGKSLIETQPLPTTDQPSTNPVLQKICFSIKSIRQISQSKRPNRVPDFSSHVASTFGASSKALLAFLSVMTLKDIVTNFNMYEMNVGNASCAEALKMIDSLREIAGIEESQKLKLSLANLQQSTSKQLLQSWKSFQELGDTKCKNQHSGASDSMQALETEAGPPQDCGIDEYVDEIMDKLDIPETLKEELASLSVGIRSESNNEEQMTTNEIDATIDHFYTDDALNITAATQNSQVNPSSIIKTFTDITQSNIGEPEVQTDQKTEEENCQFWQKVGAKCVVSEESTSNPGKQLTHDELSTDDEVQNMSSANMVRCKESESSSEQHERHTSEEEQAECEEIHQKSREYDSLDKEDKKPNAKHHVELAVGTKDSMCSENTDNKLLSEEAQSEGECEELRNVAALSTSASQPDSKIQQEMQTVSTRQNLSSAESARKSEIDEPINSHTDQPEIECKNLKIIAEECLSDTEEELENIEEEVEPHDDQRNHDQQVCGSTPKNDNFNSEDENNRGDITPVWKVQNESRNLSNLVENQVSFTIKDDSGFIKESDTLAKHYGFDVDEDSGNDHSNCDEQTEVTQPKVKVGQIGCSIEEELSDEAKESSSEEVHVARYGEQSYPTYQATQASEKLAKDLKCERALEKVTHQPKEQISQSVAERVSLLENQVAEAQRTKSGTVSISNIRRVSQRRGHLASDVEDSSSDSPTSQSALHTRSAPQSSLSFSYDSNGVVTTEPDANRVKSIREMFLSKSAAEIQQGQRRFPSPNASERSESRTQTSASGGYQSQTSSELSSGEDDSSRKSISKGFVRRTIERLYGKKDPRSDEDASQSLSSDPKRNKKEHSITSRAKAMSELSSFNSTNALTTLTEVTRCIPFNAQVGPGENVGVDEGKWIPKDNTLIRKSISDPVGINKTFSPQHQQMCEDTEENAPYSLFSTKSDLEDESKSFSTKCTYFSLPHTSDSDLCQDELSAVNRESVEDAKDTEKKMQVEKNSTLPRVGVTDFKMLDNKVHPLVEGPADGEVVVVQPGKGPGAVDRRVQEPDVLDFLYNFCGQNCPIL